jgi:glycosyltransferase involved in cell wall biosynthesis
MRVLFIHNNFPAQYRHLAGRLAAEGSHDLVAIGSPTAKQIPGVRLLRYPSIDIKLDGVHPFARRFELESRRCEQVLYCLTGLRASGFEPDLVLAHPGWGETMPLRAFFPKARILVYCEFFYGMEGRDVGFDPEFPELGIDFHVGLHLKNAASLLALTESDGGISPTAWQRSTYPKDLQGKITVQHEGVDTRLVVPNPKAAFRLPDGRTLTRNDEVITFVARNLEPLRGYHQFMRALPQILRHRPKAQVVIVGGDGVSYGAAPPAGTTWRSLYLKEVEDAIDMTRVHLVGSLRYDEYLKVLQISSAHVYLTYPFVLSWSLIEAMSAGALVIGSATAPVEEVIDGTNGLLVPFFDKAALADAAIRALADPARTQDMRVNARRTAVERFDLETKCLPAMLEMLQPPTAIIKRFRRFPSRNEIAARAV